MWVVPIVPFFVFLALRAREGGAVGWDLQSAHTSDRDVSLTPAFFVVFALPFALGHAAAGLFFVHVADKVRVYDRAVPFRVAFFVAALDVLAIAAVREVA